MTSEVARGEADRAEGPKLSLVVATISQRPEGLRRLIESVADDPISKWVEIVIVDQDLSRGSMALAEAMMDYGMHLTYVHMTRRGISHARNEGIHRAVGRYLAFPDDDAWYEGGALSKALDLLESKPNIDIVCGMQVTSQGAPSMLRWQRSAGPVGRYNLIRTAISSTIFVRREILLSLRGFSEDLGVGSDGWFGAGEETDLLLRALDRGASIHYDPTLLVCQEDVRPLASEAFKRKRVLYGCGIGEVLRRHSYPLWYTAYLASRKLGLIATLTLLGRLSRVPLEVAWTRGFVAGVSGSRPPST